MSRDVTKKPWKVTRSKTGRAQISTNPDGNPVAITWRTSAQSDIDVAIYIASLHNESLGKVTENA